jgi:hypothetical protein
MDEISDEQLISMAKEAAKKAYVPYSHFHVGSAASMWLLLPFSIQLFSFDITCTKTVR